MNEEYFKKHKKRASLILSRQPKMSHAERVAQAQRVLGTTNQHGNPYQTKNSKRQETENPPDIKDFLRDKDSK